MKSRIRTIFMGSTDFSLAILKKLKNANFIKLILIVTNPDKPVGRHQILTFSPTKIFAQKHNIPFIQPEVIKSENFYKKIKKCNPDLIIVAAYGKIIPKRILSIPKYGSLNVHPSLLPKWRGPSPIQYAILNGDKITGTTIILMDEFMDHGPIVAVSKLKIQKIKFNFSQLSKKLAGLSAELLIKTIPKWINREIQPKAQNDNLATYSKIIKKEDGKVDFIKETANEIERKIRAFYPWPGAYVNIKIFGKNKILKILEAKVIKKIPKKNLMPGDFFKKNKEVAIVCKKDSLLLKKVQVEGKKPISGEDFYKGYHKQLINFL